MRSIESFDQWRHLAGELRRNGYRLSSFQYSWYESAGFHAWFWSPQRPEIEIVTQSESVQEAIVGFNGEK